MAFQRLLTPYLDAFVQHFPVVSLVGPRGAGKTQLCFAGLPRSRFVDLNRPDTREELRQDPTRFLSELPPRTVLAGAHRVPELLPQIATALRQTGGAGRLVLVGDRPLLHEDPALHGRHARLWLLPLSLAERPPGLTSINDVLWAGGFPQLLEGRLPASVWFSSYVAEFLDRDLRRLVDVTDPVAFLGFLRAVAGQTGQLLNVSALASEAGVAHGTAKAWLAALEAALLVLPAPAWLPPDGARGVKAPRLHLADTGLACWLLGIESPSALALHPKREALFQTFVWTELLKSRLHRGAPAQLLHVRDRKGDGVDVLHLGQDERIALQALLVPRSGSAAVGALSRFVRRHPSVRPVVVHAGDERLMWKEIQIVSWRDLDGLLGR